MFAVFSSFLSFFFFNEWYAVPLFKMQTICKCILFHGSYSFPMEQADHFFFFEEPFYVRGAIRVHTRGKDFKDLALLLPLVPYASGCNVRRKERERLHVWLLHVRPFLCPWPCLSGSRSAFTTGRDIGHFLVTQAKVHFALVRNCSLSFNRAAILMIIITLRCSWRHIFARHSILDCKRDAWLTHV